MRKTSYVALTFLILLCFSIFPSLANPQMNILSSGTINYSSSGQTEMLRQSMQTWSWSASKFASIIDVYQGHYDALSVFPQIKAVKPDALGFVYYNLIDVWRSGHAEYDSAKLQLFLSSGWILKDASGAYVTNLGASSYFADFGHAGYQAWVANWCKSYVDQYGLSGVSLDNWFTDNNLWYYASATAINPRTGTYWTSQQVSDATKAMTLKIRQVLGSSKIILVNGVYNGNHFFGRQSTFENAILNGGIDAVMSEGWVSTYDASAWYSEEMWKKSIDFAVWMENDFAAAGGNYFMPIHTDSSFTSGNNFPSDMTEVQYNAFALYGYASRLLTVKQLDTMMCLGYYIERAFPQSLFQINIGDPAEDYHIISGTHVYERAYTQGIVYVNPTSTSYNVNLPSGHFHNAVTGADVTSTLTVQPHTGLIITKV